MSKAIIDEQSLTDIADAIRAKNGSADTYTPSEMATAITDLPTPTTKGLSFTYDSDGYAIKAEIVGMTSVPGNYAYSAFYRFGKDITLIFPADLSYLGNNAFTYTNTIKEVVFKGNVPNLLQSVFAQGGGHISLYDFSHHSGSIPSLYNTATLDHASGCVIKVPSALLSTWQTTAVWQDLTGVVWQGV